MSALLKTALPMYVGTAHLTKPDGYGNFRLYSPKDYVLPFQFWRSASGTITAFAICECDLKGTLSGNTTSLATRIADLDTGTFNSKFYVINNGLILATPIAYKSFVIKLTVGGNDYYSELITRFDYLKGGA
jgi:hypothetical protein